MLDARTLEKIPEHWLHEAEYWRDTPFVWKWWTRPHDDWTHDHCRFVGPVFAMPETEIITTNRAP
jgi:hypothetical protein